jgi:hypothetical protein
MRGCGMFNGILFSRKPCPEPAATTCGRCGTAICKRHVRPQAKGPFLCPNCDAYQNDDDWSFSRRDNSWHYRNSSSDARPVAAGAAAGTAAGAAANDLSDDDKAGLSTNAAGAWHGPDDISADAADADGDGPDSDTDDDGGFDAS